MGPRSIAALALLPLTPLVAIVVFRLALGTGVLEHGLLATHLNWLPVKLTVLLVALAVVLVPAGLILMRQPDASGAWALGLLAIAFGVIGAAYAASGLALSFPTVSATRLSLIVALSTVPTAAGALMMRKKGLSSTHALAFLAIALAIVGVIVSATDLVQSSVTETLSSAELAASIGTAMILSGPPLIVGLTLMRKREVSGIAALGFAAIGLGLFGALLSALRLLSRVANVDTPSAAHLVDLPMTIALIVVPTLLGALLVRKKDLSVASAIGAIAIALGVIGMTHGTSIVIATLLSNTRSFVLYDLVALIIMYVPLTVALSVVPWSAGFSLVRRPDASGAWALGILVVVCGIIGTTYSATQLFSVSDSIVFFTVGAPLFNAAWLP